MADIAETEYAYLIDPSYATTTQFGIFYHHPDHPTRHDANQLAKCRDVDQCSDAFFAELDRLYTPLKLDFKKISGYDRDTLDALRPELLASGWSIKQTETMVFTNAPQRSPNPLLDIRTITPNTIDDLESIYQIDGQVGPGFRFHRSQDERIGGEYVVAYLNGVPISSTGWYVVNRIARFRRIRTVDWAQGIGAATTLIRHIQAHPIVRQQQALVIFCDANGPLRLYEELGFVPCGSMWECLLDHAVPAT